MDDVLAERPASLVVFGYAFDLAVEVFAEVLVEVFVVIVTCRCACLDFVAEQADPVAFGPVVEVSGHAPVDGHLVVGDLVVFGPVEVLFDHFVVEDEIVPFVDFWIEEQHQPGVAL